MIAGTANLKTFLDEAQTLMTEARSSIKNMSNIRNLTARSMAVPVVTRWSGYAAMAYNFIDLYDELLMASTGRDATSAFAKSLDSTRTYRDTVIHHTKMLRELDIITVILQGKYRSLVNCRVAIDTVLETIKFGTCKPTLQLSIQGDSV
jgi:hypothetical protein